MSVGRKAIELANEIAYANSWELTEAARTLEEMAADPASKTIVNPSRDKRRLYSGIAALIRSYMQEPPA